MSSLTVIAFIILPPLLFSSPVSSALVNRTIDDENGDSVTGIQPTYGPDDSYWHQGSTCSQCYITPLVDKTQTFDGTWHDGTYSPGGPDLTISFSFTGTAVYVFNIIPNTVDLTDTLANITFTVDGAHADQYFHNPDSTSTLLYNQLVYSSTGLANQEHFVIMRSTGTRASLMLFDYAVYTAEQSTTSSDTSTSSTSSASATSISATSSSSAASTSSSSHSKPVAAIAGGTVGGIAFLAILAVFGFFFLRRRNPKESRPPSAHLETKPFVEGTDAAAYAAGVAYHGSQYAGSGYGGGSPYDYDTGSVHGGGPAQGYGPDGGGAPGNGESNYPRHAPRPSDAPTIPLLPSVMPLPRSPEPKMPLIDSIQSPQGTPSATLRRQNTTALQQHAELTQRIRALEDQMRGITVTPVGSTFTGRPASSGDDVVRALQSELAALRSEVARLNAQLAEERMMGGGESLPPYWEDAS